MENRNIKGHRTGIFTEKDGNTEIDFTEEATARKVIMKPFVTVGIHSALKGANGNE